jgi:hypothetical protein
LNDPKAFWFAGPCLDGMLQTFPRDLQKASQRLIRQRKIPESLDGLFNIFPEISRW